jgi:DNA anti-recombination protein RmuC
VSTHQGKSAADIVKERKQAAATTQLAREMRELANSLRDQMADHFSGLSSEAFQQLVDTVATEALAALSQEVWDKISQRLKWLNKKTVDKLNARRQPGAPLLVPHSDENPPRFFIKVKPWSEPGQLVCGHTPVDICFQDPFVRGSIERAIAAQYDEHGKTKASVFLDMNTGILTITFTSMTYAEIEQFQAAAKAAAQAKAEAEAEAERKFVEEQAAERARMDARHGDWGAAAPSKAQKKGK